MNIKIFLIALSIGIISMPVMAMKPGFFLSKEEREKKDNERKEKADAEKNNNKDVQSKLKVIIKKEESCQQPGSSEKLRNSRGGLGIDTKDAKKLCEQYNTTKVQILVNLKKGPLPQKADIDALVRNLIKDSVKEDTKD